MEHNPLSTSGKDIKPAKQGEERILHGKQTILALKKRKENSIIFFSVPEDITGL